MQITEFRYNEKMSIMNRTKNVKKEERKMSKGKKVKIVIEGIILLFIVYCVVLKMLPVSTGRLSTYEEINDAVATAASKSEAKRS